jgi:hypothetical protein
MFVLKIVVLTDVLEDVPTLEGLSKLDGVLAAFGGPTRDQVVYCLGSHKNLLVGLEAEYAVLELDVLFELNGKFVQILFAHFDIVGIGSDGGGLLGAVLTVVGINDSGEELAHRCCESKKKEEKKIKMSSIHFQLFLYSYWEFVNRHK